jgi:1-acyl-sn-glycerol-3-phosphate acyltransferase
LLHAWLTVKVPDMAGRSGRSAGANPEPWWRLGELTAGPLFRLFCPIRFDGLEAFPREGGAILASNHVSPLDPVALGLAARERRRVIRYLAAAELFDHRRWMTFALPRLGAVPVRRGARDVGALDEAIEILVGGGIVGVFPEGLLNPRPGLLPGRTGAARLALATGAPILPMALWGTQDRWWPNRPLKLSLSPRTPVVVVVGSPILPSGPQQPREARRLIDEVMVRIAEAENRARALCASRSGGRSPLRRPLLENGD